MLINIRVECRKCDCISSLVVYIFVHFGCYLHSIFVKLGKADFGIHLHCEFQS
jgi:hypothetical protein